MNYNPGPRIRFMAVAVLVVAFVFTVKLYILQIVHGDEFKDRASRQYARVGENLFDRGSIFFKGKDGNVISAAALQSGFTVAIEPNKIKDAESVFESVKKVIPITKEEFLSKAGKTDDPYEEIAKKIDEKEASKLEGIQGVSIYKERWRFYPGGTLGAHTVGLVAYKENTLAGRYGLESYYDDVLRRDNEKLYVNFFAEIFSGVGKVLKKEEGEGDIIASIEPTAQLFLEREIEKVHKKWNSKQTGGVIMDPKSGAIIAMAALPSFNPNSFKTEDPGVFKNPLIEDVYEMGSIMKPLTLAAGIDAGVIKSDSTYNDKGFLIRDGIKISNFDGKGRGVVSMQEVLSQSLNTGAVYIEEKLGKNRFADYMRSFGLGEETGIDLPGEIPGLIENLKSPRDIEPATAAYGQGIAVTPIAMTRALASLANGGFLPNPHLVERIDYKSGLFRSRSYGEGEQVIKKETAEEVTRMLVRVVDTALLGGSIKMKRYTIAAKTGTAQIARPEVGGYYDDRYLHSFFGYFPAYEPRFIIFLYTVEPKGVTFASHTLAEPFMSLAKSVIDYYNIAPDR